MPIITISRGSYSKGKEIAEGVARKLGFECISRDVLIEASEHFNIPEIKLVRALHDAPSILDRFTYGKERYVAFIEKAFLEHVQKGNIVYHGLAGHFFLKGVSHALKVRIIADLEDRVALEMERENISREKALHILKKDDYERRRWSMALYGMDTADAGLYDLVIHIKKITVENAIEIICHAAQLPNFQPTPQSQKHLDDLVLAAQARAAVIDSWPNVKVAANDGHVIVYTQAPIEQEIGIQQRIQDAVGKLPGVKEVEVHVLPPTD